EQRLGSVDVHGKTSGERTHRRYQRKTSPRKVSSGGKIVKIEPGASGEPEKTRSRWGKGFPRHRDCPRKNGACQQRIRLQGQLLTFRPTNEMVRMSPRPLNLKPRRTPCARTTRLKKSLDSRPR